MSLIPDLSEVWPPIRVEPIDPIGVPLLNTVVLLSSRVSVTYSHYSVLIGDNYGSVAGLIFTLRLGVFFTLLQRMEYMDARFNISDSVYGSVFFMATRFHGFHVIVRSAFLGVSLVRILARHFTMTQHVGFECAI